MKNRVNLVNLFNFPLENEMKDTNYMNNTKDTVERSRGRHMKFFYFPIFPLFSVNKSIFLKRDRKNQLIHIFHIFRIFISKRGYDSDTKDTNNIIIIKNIIYIIFSSSSSGIFFDMNAMNNTNDTVVINPENIFKKILSRLPKIPEALVTPEATQATQQFSYYNLHATPNILGALTTATSNPEVSKSFRALYYTLNKKQLIGGCNVS
jgi:hypothetical protein